jgi:prepilin-type N-terminal cleavage/methylation domain-containing protein
MFEQQKDQVKADAFMVENRLRHQPGFTLMEILIVVVLLAIFAMAVIPQIVSSTEDVRLQTMNRTLQKLRKAIELYHVEHNGKYPGQTKAADGKSNSNKGEAAESATLQLVLYTDINGQVSLVKNAQFRYGPYMNVEPSAKNPFMDGEAASSTVVVDTTDVTERIADGTTGWKYQFKTGVIYPNDGGSTNGVAHQDL